MAVQKQLGFLGVTLRQGDFHSLDTSAPNLTGMAKPREFASKLLPDWCEHYPTWDSMAPSQGLPREAGEESMLRSLLLKGSPQPRGWELYPQLGRQSLCSLQPPVDKAQCCPVASKGGLRTRLPCWLLCEVFQEHVRL